jgi:hypothetical protein
MGGQVPWRGPGRAYGHDVPFAQYVVKQPVRSGTTIDPVATIDSADAGTAGEGVEITATG